MTEQNAETPQADQPVEKPKVGPRAKLAFLAVLVVVVGIIWYIQRNPPPPEDWGTNLDEAMELAGKTNRRVLVWFTGTRNSQQWKDMRRRVRIPQTRDIIGKKNFVCVNVEAGTSMDSDVARRYRITKLPTFIIFDPQGNEAKRTEGPIGEQPFRDWLDPTGK